MGSPCTITVTFASYSGELYTQCTRVSSRSRTTVRRCFVFLGRFIGFISSTLMWELMCVASVISEQQSRQQSAIGCGRRHPFRMDSNSPMKQPFSSSIVKLEGCKRVCRPPIAFLILGLILNAPVAECTFSTSFFYSSKSLVELR